MALARAWPMTPPLYGSRLAGRAGPAGTRGQPGRQARPIAALRRYARKIRYLLRYESVATTALVCTAELLALLKLPLLRSYRYHAYFDTRTSGLATAGIVASEDLDMAAERRVHASEYAPTPPPLFHHVMGFLDIPFEQFDFVDLGSGKGRVLLLAACLPFARIHGIELARPLHEQAQANIAVWQRRAGDRRDIQSLCMDVAAFRLPGRPTVLYLFNPFDEAVFRQMLGHLAEGLRAEPQHTFLIYYHVSERDRELLERGGLFREVNFGCYDGHRWSIYEFDPRAARPPGAPSPWGPG
jgi:hypothetical protein